MVALLVLLTLPARAGTSLWQVRDDQQNVVYLGGTIHLLRESDYPLPQAFQSIYQRSDTLVLETDLDVAATPEGQQLLARLMTASESERVEQVLSVRTRLRLKQMLEGYGARWSDLKSYKVSMLVIVLNVAEMRRLGMTAEGVDAHFHAQAQRDNKPVMSLETFEQQVTFLSRLGQGNEENFVTMSLQELDQTDAVMREMVASWKIGDVAALRRSLLEEMQRDYPAMYQQLLVARNQQWLPQLETLFQKPGTELVLVGVGHMLGEQGLLSLLRQRGYQVEPVALEATHPLNTGQVDAGQIMAKP
jgi:uncharacterized protein YbaP (TraB family)